MKCFIVHDLVLMGLIHFSFRTPYPLLSSLSIIYIRYLLHHQRNAKCLESITYWLKGDTQCQIHYELENRKLMKQRERRISRTITQLTGNKIILWIIPTCKIHWILTLYLNVHKPLLSFAYSMIEFHRFVRKYLYCFRLLLTLWIHRCTMH